MFEYDSGSGAADAGEPLPGHGSATERVERVEPVEHVEHVEPAGPVEPVVACGCVAAVGGRWRSPGEVVAGHVAGAVAQVAGATGVAPVFARLSGQDVATGLESVDRLRARTETLTLHLVIEALDRGLPTSLGLNAHDWVSLRCPDLTRSAVGDLVTVARGVGDPLHAHLRDQVLTSGVSVHRAACVMRALTRVKPFLPTTPGPEQTGPEGAQGVSEYEEAVALLSGVAAGADFTDRDLRRVTDHLTSTVLPDRDHDTREKAVRELRGVHESSLADGSLVRFIITAGAEGAALLRSILASPLTAPCPTQAGDRDTRTAAHRRYDALMTVLKRGVAGGDHTPTTPKASVSITIAWDVLAQALTGTGTTTTGDVLCPETIRRMACDADLIPLVLGSDREILDQGRTKRLITRGQRRALEHRDKTCTFPGCTTPAPWCEGHHIIHWSRGGESNLPNYALLCGHHHTIVHTHDLTATTDPTGVTWHL